VPSVKLLDSLLTTSNPPPIRSSSLGYTPWLKTAVADHFAGYDWDHDYLVRIRRSLARVTRGECKRLVVSLPPQHGKTSVLTVPYPVWRLEREPTLRVAVGAYNQTHANRFSRKSRRMAAGRFELARDRKAVNEWETAAGGYYVSVGVGAGITGLPVDLLVIDDPVKNAEEAMSEARREAVWEWWTDSLHTRLSKDAAVILVMTRWHTEDLAGRLLAQGGWEEAVFRAIAEEDDPLGRPVGAALCPALHPIEQLTAARDQSPTSFRALYQQQPLDLTGGFFRGLERVPVVGAAPTADQFTARCRFWDLASTEAQAGADPDWTAGALVAKHKDGTFWVLDVQRQRLGPLGVRALIRQTAQADGVAVRVRVEREGGASGKLAADSIVREDLSGFSAAAVKPKGNKQERAEPFAAQVEAGNVRLVAGAWVRAWLDELRTFPTGRHDDMVDASSGGFGEVARGAASVTVTTI
jgi:predicted phage terminase large subunit-like protein